MRPGRRWGVPAKMPITSVKYPGEARVCAGACMYKVPEDTPGRYEGFKGVTLPIFGYTGKQVVGVKAYEKACAAELARVLSMKGCWLNNGGYEGRWGATRKDAAPHHRHHGPCRAREHRGLRRHEPRR